MASKKQSWHPQKTLADVIGSTSLCLVPVLFVQQKSSRSGLMSSPVWVQFELLRFLGNFWALCIEFLSYFFMGFYFYGWYTHTLMVMKRKLNGIYTWLSCFFGVLMIVMNMRNEKIILKNCSVISPWHLNRNVFMPKWGWLEELIGVERQTYFLSILVCLVRPTSYSICSVSSLHWVSGVYRRHPEDFKRHGNKSWPKFRAPILAGQEVFDNPESELDEP